MVSSDLKASELAIFWFRRDLRIEDNAGLYHALKSGLPVLPVFIFDRNILDRLEEKEDARVSFIHAALVDLDQELRKFGSSLCVKYGSAETAWESLLTDYSVKAVYTNSDYEPYASRRDGSVLRKLNERGISFHSFKDQLIFEKEEVLKDDGRPYTVFTPYKRKWLERLDPDFHLKSYPVEKYCSHFIQFTEFKIPSLEEIGFRKSQHHFPDKEYKSVIKDYASRRDFPAIEGTSRISIHLRFGTLSIRNLGRDAWFAAEKTWLSELIWRDFYAMILWHFPHSAKHSFKKEYDTIHWRNNEIEFKAWCEGKTGYPLVDAGMRQLNETGWMHNRVRMVTASFLCKHLLIDWRWGEAYFAAKLIDYDMASNVGGWQWAASSGNDAVPYFRVFNPDLQTQRFDPKLDYINRWIPEFNDPFLYPKPIVGHKIARERVLAEFKRALS